MKFFTKSFLVIFIFYTLFSTNKLQADSLLGDSFSAIGDGSSEIIESETMDTQVYTSIDEVTDNNAEIIQDPDEQDNDDDDDDDGDGDDEVSEDDSSLEEALIKAEDQDEIADNSDDDNVEVDDNDVVQISGIETDSDIPLVEDATTDFSYFYKTQPTTIDKSLDTKDVCFSNQFKIIEGIRKYNKNNKVKMTSLELKVLTDKNAYMNPIDLPTENCEYASEGDVTSGGYVYCKYHGCEGRNKCLETLRILTKAVNDYNSSHDANDRLSEFDDSDIGKLISSKCLAEQPNIEKNCSYTSFGNLSEGGKIYCERHGEIDISIPEESEILEIATGNKIDNNKNDNSEQVASSTNIELGKLLNAEDVELNTIASRIRKKINKNYYICQSFCTDGDYWYVAFTNKSKLLPNNKYDFSNQKTLLLKFKRNELKSKAPKLIAKRKMGKIGHCNSMTYNDKTNTILIAPCCTKDGMTMPLRQIDVKTFFDEKKLKTSSKGKAIFLKTEDGTTEIKSPETKYSSIVYDSKNDQYIAKIVVASNNSRLYYLAYFDADFKLKKTIRINNLNFKIKKEFTAQSITTDGTNIFGICNDKKSSTRVNYIIPFDMEGNRVGQIIVLKNKPSNPKKTMQHMIYSGGEYYIASNGKGKFIVDRVYLKDEKDDDDDDDSNNDNKDNSADGNKLVTLTKFDTTGKKGYSKPLFKSLTVPAKYVASKTHVEQMWYAAKMKKSAKGLSKGDKILVIRKKKGLCIIQNGSDKGKVIKLSKNDYDLCQQITNCRVVYSKETVEKFMSDHKVTSKTNYALWINKHIQHAFLFKKKGGKWVLYEDSPFKKGIKVSTGSYKHATRCDTGYSINHCEIFNHDDGFQGIKRYMHYSSPGGNGLHGTTGTGKPLSHGCVRFDTKIRDYIWEKLPLHTRVILH